MHVFDVFTILLIFAAIFSYINSRAKAIPPTVGFMVGSLLIALTLIILKSFGVPFADQAIEVVSGVDFEKTVLYGILSFLLFAGSLQLEINDLAKEKWIVLTLATLGVIISTFVVGTLSYWIFPLFGLSISYLYALIFGALISPTDPIVVISTLKGAKASQSLKMQIIGEALFNDGIAIAVFVLLTSFANYTLEISVPVIAQVIFYQLVVSIILGLILGLILHYLLFDVDNFSTQVLISLGVVSGGYDLALYLGVSGPIAIVIAGLFFRNYKQQTPHDSFKPLYDFWTLLDEFLNAILFILMGLEVLTLNFTLTQAFAGFISIFIVLFGRYISVFIPAASFGISRKAVTLLTWAGLRGGISLAMALSLADNTIICSTYIVVLFSTLVQGLTLKGRLAP